MPPPLPSPAFRFASQAVGLEYVAAASATVVATVDNLAGVDTVDWSVAGTDDSSSPSDYPLTISGPKNSVCTLTAGGLGTALILRATINSGVNPQTGAVDTRMATTAACRVLAANGLAVGAFNEQYEHGPQGWLPLVNTAIRNAATGTLANPSYAPVSATVPLRGPSGADLRAGWFAFAAAASVAGSGLVRLTSAAQSGVAAQSEANAAHDVALVGIDGADGVIVGGLYAAKVGLEVGSAQLTWDGASLTFPYNASATFITGAAPAASNTNGGDLYVEASPGSGTGLRGPARIYGGDVHIGAHTGSFAVSSPTPSGTIFLKGTTISLAATGAISLSGTELDLGCPVVFIAGATATISQAAAVGTGTNVGGALTISAQPGQAQTGGANNNNGGDLDLIAGAAGTGGGGTSAARGNVNIGGAVHVINADNSWSVLAQMAGRIKADTTGLSFFGGSTAAKPTVSGSRGSNAALASLLTGLAALGLITDGSS